MSFNQIVWKMARVHYKKYIVYFLCNSFTVMFFFMFSTVYFNEQVVQVKELDSIQYLLSIPAVALVVFTVFFISYAHHVFIKRRKSEFGLFMTLGMSGRDISKLILLENGFIALISITTGIIAGTIFSKIFFFLLMNSVGLQTVSFHLNSKMFMYTMITFLIVFMIAVGNSLYLTLNRTVIHNLKSVKVSESIEMKSPLIGSIGMAIIVSSILGLYYTYSGPTGGDYLLLWTMSTLLGVYISLHQFTGFFISFFKKNSTFYYRRLLFLTSLDYKFKQLTSLLMLVTVMIMITILFSTIIMITYTFSEKEVMEQNPYDIAFTQMEDKNNLSSESLYSILDQKDNPIQKHLEVPFVYFYQKDSYGDWPSVYAFMPIDHFNKLTSSQTKLKNKEFIYFLNENPENGADRSSYDNGLSFSTESGDLNYKLKEVFFGKSINNLANLNEVFIVGNTEFELLKEKMDVFKSKLYLVNVANWKDSANAVEKLENAFKSHYEENPSTIGVGEERAAVEDDVFQVSSKVEAYNFNKNSNGLLFFITVFLSVIFFFGSFILLYLNLFSEVDKERDKYKKLHLIGITVKEVKRSISNEIATLFYFPTIVGTTLAFLYIVAMAKDVGGVMKNPEILLYFGIVAGIYYCIQTGFFLYARKRMVLYLTDSDRIHTSTN